MHEWGSFLAGHAPNGGKPMRIKQSICYPIFRAKDMALDELFGTAAEIGYAAVELWDRGILREEGGRNGLAGNEASKRHS